MIRWAIFVSGEGSNLQNVLDLIAAQKIRHQEVALVHADRECRAVERAKMFSPYPVKTWICSPRAPNFLSDLLSRLEEAQVDRIFLLGYRRILSPEFLKAWGRPVVNLHPSLLPKYPGLEAIEKAWAAKEAEVGVTIHEVIEKVDAGKMLKQASVSTAGVASLEALKAQVHEREHSLVREYLQELEASDSQNQ